MLLRFLEQQQLSFQKCPKIWRLLQARPGYFHEAVCVLVLCRLRPRSPADGAGGDGHDHGGVRHAKGEGVAEREKVHGFFLLLV